MSTGHNRPLRLGITIMALSGALAFAGLQIARAQDGADSGNAPQASQQAAAEDQTNPDQAPGGQAGPQTHRAHGPGERGQGFGPGLGRGPARGDARDFREFREFHEFEQWQRWRTFERWQHARHGGFGGRAGMRPDAGMLDRPLLGAFRRLDLTQDQWQKVRSILMTARQQARPAAGAPRANPAQLLALLNPGDPGHAAAVQAAQDRAVARIQRANQVQQNLYDVLTPQQKTRLTQMLAQVRQRVQQRLRERGPGGPGAGGPEGPEQGPEGHG